MWLLLLTYQLSALVLSRAQNNCIGHSTFRAPANSDIDVVCGSERVELQILLCPVYFNGYNESLLALNSVHTDRCRGTADWTADPPVVRFNFSITEEGISACSNTLKVSQETGSGVFSDYSHVEHVSVAGQVCSKDPGSGSVTYHQEVMYKFSCRYPMQYLVNNTEMSVAGVSLAINDNNGSFVSTLSMQLFSDNSYSSALRVPHSGLELKTRIFVEVKASNLSNRFNVLLDRCYATTSPFHLNTTFYDLFVGCDRDLQTILGTNGQQQEAQFSFEAFRFVQSADDDLSTYYVHCATRLCLSSFCPSLVQNCTSGSNRRRRRGANDGQDTTVSDSATITSMPIRVRSGKGLKGSEGTQRSQNSDTVLVVSVIAGIIGLICVTLLVIVVYQLHKNKGLPGKRILCGHEGE